VLICVHLWLKPFPFIVLSALIGVHLRLKPFLLFIGGIQRRKGSRELAVTQHVSRKISKLLISFNEAGDP
jgi:hypothetical protein